jgi:hypothetical protein
MTNINLKKGSILIHSIGDFEARMALARELPESADSP